MATLCHRVKRMDTPAHRPAVVLRELNHALVPSRTIQHPVMPHSGVFIYIVPSTLSSQPLRTNASITSSWKSSEILGRKDAFLSVAQGTSLGELISGRTTLSMLLLCGTHSGGHASLEHTGILLPPSPECWNLRCAPPPMISAEI